MSEHRRPKGPWSAKRFGRPQLGRTRVRASGVLHGIPFFPPVESLRRVWHLGNRAGPRGGVQRGGGGRARSTIRTLPRLILFPSTQPQMLSGSLSQALPWILAVREVGADGEYAHVHYQPYRADVEAKKAAERWEG
jgi:hypothetical protein